MLKRAAPAGYTLIEVSLVLALTALFLTMVLQGNSRQRRQIQFSDSIERLYANLVNLRGEALATVNTNGCAGGSIRTGNCDPATGTDFSRVSVLGKLVEFIPGSDLVNVYTVKNNLSSIGVNCLAPGSGIRGRIDFYTTDPTCKLDKTSFRIPSGTIYYFRPGTETTSLIPSCRYDPDPPGDEKCVFSKWVAFVRNVDGRLGTVTFDSVTGNPPKVLPPASVFFQNPENWAQDEFRDVAIYEFRDGTGADALCAMLIINGSSGEITKEFNKCSPF